MRPNRSEPFDAHNETKEQSVKGIISVLSLAAPWKVGALCAQMAPVNELGLRIGHLHMSSPDREKDAKVWVVLGGQLENNLSGSIPIGFPGIVILLPQGEIMDFANHRRWGYFCDFKLELRVLIYCAVTVW